MNQRINAGNFVSNSRSEGSGSRAGAEHDPREGAVHVARRVGLSPAGGRRSRGSSFPAILLFGLCLSWMYACEPNPCNHDGVKDPGEQCDDGNFVDGDGCTECELDSCPDGNLDPYEECDDGNFTDDDGCTNLCTLPVCGDGIVQAGVGEECDDGNTANGDGCDSACQVEGPDFTLNTAYVTPLVNLLGGTRPRFDENFQVDVMVEASAPMGQLTAEIQGCDLAPPYCDPVVEPVPGVSQWSLRLPPLTGAPDPAGKHYTVLVTGEAQGSPAVDSTTLEFDVFPPDPGLDVACTKRYDGGSLYVAVTLVDNGNLPINPNTGLPYTLADMYDARFLIYQEHPETGFDLDETDWTRNYFILIQPTEFHLADDGIYAMVFSGQLNFVEPIQTYLLFDTVGGDNDVCTLVP